MQAKEEKGRVIARLMDGEDLFCSMAKLVEDFKIKSAIIVSGIGMLREFELNFFKDGKYLPAFRKEAMELVAMHGSIAEDGSLHIHCAVAGEDHTVMGGHLTKAKAAVLTELVILKLDKVRIGREHNPKTGLRETTVS